MVNKEKIEEWWGANFGLLTELEEEKLILYAICSEVSP